MKSILLIILGLFFIDGVGAIELTKDQDVRPKRFYSKIEYEERDWIVVSGIRINNSIKEYNFIIDTGSSETSLSQQLIDELNIQIVGKDIVSDGLAKCSEEYTYSNISINNISFNNIKSYIMDFSMIRNRLCDINGIIGVNLMKHCVWQIEEGKIIFTDNIKNLSYSSFNKQKFQLSSVPLVKVKLRNNIDCEMILDLGDNTLVAFNKESTLYIRKKEVVKGWGQYYSTAYRQSEQDTFKIFRPCEPLIFGDAILHEIVADISYDKDTRLGIVGSEILDYYKLIIDFPNKKLYTKQISTEYKNHKLYTFGFKWSFVDKDLRVTYIWENSSAQKAGLQVGQIIERINDTPIKDLFSFEECIMHEKMRTFLDKETITIVLSDSDKILTLTKAPLFSTELVQ